MTPEDERLEQIREWWKEYRWTILGGTMLGVATIGGWTGWNEYTRVQEESESSLYEQVSVAVVRDDDLALAQNLTEELMRENSSSGYAGKALLLLAKISFDKGDIEGARETLQRAIDKAEDGATVHAARIRYGQLLIAQKQYEEAIKKLDVDRMDGFDSHYHELRGDAYRALGKLKQAHDSYSASIESLAPGSAYETVLALKLNDTQVKE